MIRSLQSLFVWIRVLKFNSIFRISVNDIFTNLTKLTIYSLNVTLRSVRETHMLSEPYRYTSVCLLEVFSTQIWCCLKLVCSPESVLIPIDFPADLQRFVSEGLTRNRIHSDPAFLWALSDVFVSFHSEMCPTLLYSAHRKVIMLLWFKALFLLNCKISNKWKKWILLKIKNNIIRNN